MQASLEIVRNNENLPIKVSVHSIDGIDTHWHDAIEILLVLKGSINIRLGNDRYLLKEDDLILINKNEVHNNSKTSEDNVLLLLQLDTNFFSYICPDLNKIYFNPQEFIVENKNTQKLNILKSHLARVVWELNKKRKGYKLYILSEVQLLIAHLVNNYEYSFLGTRTISNKESELERTQTILSYINENFERKISLQDVANHVDLSIYYLSRLFKENTGITYQEYLNNLRLDKSINLLTYTDRTMAEISFESGFSSIKSFNNLFKQTFDITPTEYRRKNKEIARKDLIKSTRTYLDVDRNTALNILYKYLNSDINTVEITGMNQGISKSIKINVKDNVTHLFPYWKKLTTFSKASEGLRKNFQEQLKELQYEIGFEYIRFHGIFCDDMMVCNLDDNGDIIYNWTYVDELFDFFKSVNIKPFVELGFMPSEIKKSDEKGQFWWGPNISGPRDIRLWTELVIEFIKHCVNRYGIDEVNKWYFEVWNEPELNYIFWVEGKEAYFEFYKETVNAIKSISKELKVGGPAITHQVIYDSDWLVDFIDYCKDKTVPLDFISIHIYPEYYPAYKEVMSNMAEELISIQGALDVTEIENMFNLTKVYNDENHTPKTLELVNEIINDKFIFAPELHVTEWNASADCRNLINDTCFIATFIVKNVLQSIGKADSLGYWTFTDLMEEFKAGISPFHGGFGLINNNGLKKPSYFAYYLLSKLGDSILKQGEDYIITKKGEDIQILAYNFAYFDNLFMHGDTSALTYLDRYKIYEEKMPITVSIAIEGIHGNYKVTRYSLNQEDGSVFDKWVEMGSPENMSEEEISYLQGVARPKVVVNNITLSNKYIDQIYLPIHGIELVTLEKKI